MFRVPFTVCLFRASAALHRRTATVRPRRRLRIRPALIRRALLRPGALVRRLRPGETPRA